MKIFYVNSGLCYYDMTALYISAEEARQYYPPCDIIVEAPDYVHENWGFDGTKEGNERFVRPIPEEGWQYNDETGALEPIPGWEPPASTVEQLQDAQAALAELGVEQEEVDA